MGRWTASAFASAFVLCAAPTAPGGETARATFRVEGMTCDGCAAAVEVQLHRTEGVTGYEVSFERGEARVSYDPERTTPEKVASAIALSGFRAFVQPGSSQADDSGTHDPAHDPNCDQACCRRRKPPPQGRAAELTLLEGSLAPLAADFNAGRGRARFLAILSPTCGVCIHGAEAVREALLHGSPARDLELFVVWAPMLPGDDEAAARVSSALLRHPGVRQYYDHERAAGAAFRRDVFPEAVPQMRRSLPPGHFLRERFAARDPAQPEWDIYLFFGPEREWLSKAPAPERFLRQVMLLDDPSGSGGAAEVVAQRRSVLWRDDYEKPPFAGSLVEELRALAGPSQRPLIP